MKISVQAYMGCDKWRLGPEPWIKQTNKHAHCTYIMAACASTYWKMAEKTTDVNRIPKPNIVILNEGAVRLNISILICLSLSKTNIRNSYLNTKKLMIDI